MAPLSWHALGRLVLSLILLLAFVSSATAQERLVFGVHPYKSAIELEFMFAPLTGYLSSITGKPVLMSVAKDYETHINAIGEDKVDIAFMGPASYVEMVERYGMKPLLARFVVSNVPSYYGVIVVRSDSPIKFLKDLKGKGMAFSDPRSTAGHIIPRYMFHQAGISLEDFSEHTFMGNQDNVALGVLLGDFDAGAVKQEVFAKYEHRGLRILALTPPISEHLFVASGTMPPEMVGFIREDLQRLENMPAGGTILRAMKPSATGLDSVEDSDYENLRSILRELKDNGIRP